MAAREPKNDSVNITKPVDSSHDKRAREKKGTTATHADCDSSLTTLNNGV